MRDTKFSPIGYKWDSALSVRRLNCPLRLVRLFVGYKDEDLGASTSNLALGGTIGGGVLNVHKKKELRCN